MTLRHRLIHLLAELEGYANTSLDYSKKQESLGNLDNLDWLHGQAKGELSIIHEIQRLLKRTDEIDDCLDDDEDREK